MHTILLPVYLQQGRASLIDILRQRHTALPHFLQLPLQVLRHLIRLLPCLVA